MADVYFRTANSNAALPFGPITAAGSPDGSQGAPYSALSQIATQLAAGNDCYLHPACFWALDGSTFLNLAATAPAGGGTLQRWDVPGYEGWFPTIENVIRPDWTGMAVGSGTGLWAWTLSGTTITPANEVVAIGGRLVGDGRGAEYRPEITRCRHVSPISSASIPGDFLITTSGGDTTFTVYTGSDVISPAAMFDGFFFCVRNTAWARSISTNNSKRLTLSDLQMVGGGNYSQPSTGATSQDIKLIRPRGVGFAGSAIVLSPQEVTALIEDWEIDMPILDSGSPMDSPPVNVDTSWEANNGITITKRCRRVLIKDPKIQGFTHSQIQALTAIADAAKVGGDFSWPRNIEVRKTRDLPGHNDLTGGRGYRRGLNFTGHGWIIDRQEIMQQSAISQFSGRGVVIMPKWTLGYNTEASPTNYGSGSACTLQHDTGGCQAERIVLLNPVFDEVPNFPIRLAQAATSIPEGALHILGGLVASLDTYVPRYKFGQNSNIVWDSIPPVAGGRAFTGGSAVGVFAFILDTVFLIPADQTIVAAYQTSGEDGNDPASWAERYEASDMNAYFARNSAFNSRAAANLDTNLQWIGKPKPAIPKWAN